MKMFVTGASGFIGSAVVDAALERGHQVRALVRASARVEGFPWASHPDVEVVRGDVRLADTYAASLGGVDCVAHLAAVFGDFFDQFAVTVVGTERLLAAMDEAGVGRLVLVSTFSAYDYRALAADSVLDEASPTELEPAKRDGYTQTKLYQEQITREHCAAEGIDLTVIRPGAVYGPGKLWNGGLAKTVGGVGIAIAPRSELKLTYVRNCAEAIVLAAERPEAIGETLNIVDDNLPTPAKYLAAMERHGFSVPSRVVPVPFAVMSAIANSIDGVNRSFFDGRAKLPELAVPARLAASFRPHRYSNERAKRVLGWTPRRSLDEALEEIRLVEESG